MSTKITLTNVDVKALEKAIEPAVIVDKKITLNIDVQSGKLFGVAGGHDKYKFWSTDLSEVCETFTFSEDFDRNLQVKTVILDTKAFINTMKIVGDKVNIDLNLESFIDVYETTFLMINQGKLKIQYACAPISIGNADVSEEEKQKKLGSFGDTYEFELSVDDLKKIKQLSELQTLDTNMDAINFISTEDGKLKVYNDVFTTEFETDVEGMPEHKFLIEILRLIDNDNYNVTISKTPSGVPKIVFMSNDRDIQFVCSLLVSSDTFADIDDIENEFSDFKG